MSNIVPADEIEEIVGRNRHMTRHFARAVSAERTVYVLHSQHCKSTGEDLRDCLFSQALDKGIDEATWEGHEDRPVHVTIWRDGKLRPVSTLPLGEVWPR